MLGNHLIAIHDWAKAIQEKRKAPPSAKERVSFRETLIKASENHKRNEDISRRVEAWKPRNIVIGVDIPFKGNESDYEDSTPEIEAIRFAIYWQKKNYGNIARQIHQFSKNKEQIPTEAKRMREILSNKILHDYSLKKIEDKAPAISEVTLNVEFECETELKNKDITLRFLAKGKMADPVCSDFPIVSGSLSTHFYIVLICNFESNDKNEFSESFFVKTISSTC